MSDKVDKTIQAMRLCRTDANGKQGIVGEIECPVCKGRLAYSVAKSNGHLWGRCETENCLCWIQ